MNRLELIRWAMKLTAELTDRLVADMRESAMTPTTPGGNHTVWALGHMTFIEGAMPHILLGETNPVEHWAPLFGTGSQPKTEASAYPPFDEILSKFRELRAKNIKLL